MLFDGGVKEVTMENLEALLNSSFDAKLSSIDNRSSYLVHTTEHARALFTSACDSFERSNRKPDMEMLWRATNEQHIMEQKVQYVTALRRILKTDYIADTKTLYSSYQSTLTNARTLLEDLLKLNNKFRMVLEAYANDLNSFKSAFSTMDRAVKELSSRLDDRSNELNEYTETLKEIEKLRAFSRELTELNSIGSEMQQKGEEDQDPASPVDGLKKDLSEAKAEAATIDKGIADARASITARISPLDKPARKYEHGMSKTHLTNYIDNPVETLLGNQEALSEFSRHLTSLKKEIDENRIQVKNAGETRQAMDFVLGGSISSILDEIKILKSKRSALDERTDSLERSIREIERVEGAKQRKRMAAGELKSRIESISTAKESTRKGVEQLFERHYRKKIKIIIQ